MNGAARTATRSINSEDPARKMGASPMSSPILDSPGPTLYKTALSRTPHPHLWLLRVPQNVNAQVAQLVEHCTENAGVGGSIPPLGTIPSSFNCSVRATVTGP